MLFSPQPANAVSREIVELQQQISQVLQQQQDLRSAVDTNNATLKTLVQQSLDGVNQLNAQMGTLQKMVQEVQANTGSSISSVTQTTQGFQDNLQEVQSARRKTFAAADRHAELAAEHRREGFRQCTRRRSCARGHVATGDAWSSWRIWRATGSRPRAKLLGAFRDAGDLGRHSLPERAAGFHEREIRPCAAGILRLHQEFSDERPGFERAVLPGRNLLRAERFQQCDQSPTTPS